jgi:S1-C subfamily serine protease
MSILKCSIFALLFLIAEQSFGANLHKMRQSIFKIRVTSQDANFRSPWLKHPSSKSSGTGFYVGNGRIMTNAHVIANASFISVQRDGDSQPETAYVKYVAHDCDLAILEVKSPTFFDDIPAMSLGDLPKLRSPVATIGFPTGGEQISITEGIVSRVGFRRYVHHGAARHLLVQVDSAINSGNSGGPVVQGRLVIGVAFQSYTQAENTGYIIPTPVIRRFLVDIEDGVYDGHPKHGLVTKKWSLMNEDTAEFHSIKREDGGVKVIHVDEWAPTKGIIEPGDILLSINNKKIGIDGKIDFNGERVDFKTLFDLRQLKDVVNFKIVRGNVTKNVNVTITPSKLHHLRGKVYAKYPKFFVFGGLVFTTLSRSYLYSWGGRWYKRAPLLLRYLDFFATFEPEAAKQKDIIVLAGRLPHGVNAYSESKINEVVTHVDGKSVSGISELVTALENSEKEFAIIDFWKSDSPLIISRKEILKHNTSINKNYGVIPDRWTTGPSVDGAVNLVGQK